MQALLRPFGTDAQRLWRNGPAGLVQTLLRITPEDSLDQQPVINPLCVLVFEGRLDDRAGLAAKLDIEHSELPLLSDAELVHRACSRWEDNAVEHLLGEFTFACWWPSRQRLQLARDALGGRPLFWHQQSGFFAFASLPKALFAIAGVPRAICPERLADFLALLPIRGPQSMFKDVYRLEPGHTLTLDAGVVKVRRYYQVELRRELHLGSDDQYLEAFKELTEQAVRACLRSAGPVASHLSSGFDSGTVTALAARQLATRQQRLIAYTAVPREGFDGPVPRNRHADESIGASELARKFANIDHVLIRPQPVSLIDSLREQTEAMDCMPLNPINSLWGQAIKSDAAQRGVRVLLSGHYGNMTISYAGQLYLSTLLRNGQWWTWGKELLATKREHPEKAWRSLLAQSLENTLPHPLWWLLSRMHGHATDHRAYSSITPMLSDQIELAQRAHVGDWHLKRRIWTDSQHMRTTVLRRMDGAEHSIASNLHGLEVRDPTRDQRLLDFCLSLPENQYVRNGQSRWLLRRLVGDVLPEGIWNTVSKGLQAADWFETAGAAVPQLREELARQMAHASVGDYIDLSSLSDALESWPDSGWERPEVVRTYRLKLLRGLAAGGFIRYVEPDNA
jgi:asparagine synthase (glutamine-hydrolysing)